MRRGGYRDPGHRETQVIINTRRSAWTRSSSKKLATPSGLRKTSLAALNGDPHNPRASPLTRHVRGTRDAAVLTDAQEGRHHLLHQFLQLQITLTGARGLMNTLEINSRERQRSVKSGQGQRAPSQQIPIALLLHWKRGHQQAASLWLE